MATFLSFRAERCAVEQSVAARHGLSEHRFLDYVFLGKTSLGMTKGSGIRRRWFADRGQKQLFLRFARSRQGGCMIELDWRKRVGVDADEFNCPQSVVGFPIQKKSPTEKAAKLIAENFTDQLWKLPR